MHRLHRLAVRYEDLLGWVDFLGLDLDARLLAKLTRRRCLASNGWSGKQRNESLFIAPSTVDLVVDHPRDIGDLAICITAVGNRRAVTYTLLINRKLGLRIRRGGPEGNRHAVQRCTWCTCF